MEQQYDEQMNDSPNMSPIPYLDFDPFDRTTPDSLTQSNKRKRGPESDGETTNSEPTPKRPFNAFSDRLYSLLNETPIDIWKIIFSYLRDNTSTFANLRLTARFFYQLVECSGNWNQKIRILNLEHYLYMHKQMHLIMPTNLVIVDGVNSAMNTKHICDTISKYAPNISGLSFKRASLVHTSIGDLPRNLTALDLSEAQTNITLCDFPSKLAELTISDSKFDAMSIVKFPISLTRLNLRHCQQMTGDFFFNLPQKLLELDISECNNISTSVFLVLPTSLTKLVMQKNASSNGFFEYIPTRIRELDFTGCKKMMPSELQYLSRLQCLEKLSLEGCTQIGDELGQFLPTTLANLNIRNCKKVTHKIVDLLPKGLTSLNLFNTKCAFEPETIFNFPFLKRINSSTTPVLVSPFVFAAIKNNVDVMIKLVDSGIPVEPSAIMNACYSKSYDAIKHLIVRFGVDPNYAVSCDTESNSNTEGKTPLTLACVFNYKKIVSILLANKADPNLPDKKGATPLYIAASMGSLSIVEKLVKHGAQVNLQPVDRATPFGIACQRNQIKVIEFLMKYGAVPTNNLGPHDDYDDAYTAAQNGHTEVLKILLKLGVNLDSVSSEDGTTGLYMACQNNKPETVEFLLKTCHVNPNIFTHDNDTPLYTAASKNFVGVVKLLLQYGANPNVVYPRNGASPLWIASKWGYLNIVKLLVEAKADVNFLRYYGSTPLHEACRSGYVDLAEYLIQNGANKEYVCLEYGYSTPLFAAAQHGKTPIVSMLLRYGVRVDNIKEGYNSPLTIACEHGYIDIVRLLLTANCPLKHVNERGETALATARRMKKDDIVAVLIQYGAV